MHIAEASSCRWAFFVCATLISSLARADEKLVDTLKARIVTEESRFRDFEIMLVEEASLNGLGKGNAPNRVPEQLVRTTTHQISQAGMHRLAIRRSIIVGETSVNSELLTLYDGETNATFQDRRPSRTPEETLKNRFIRPHMLLLAPYNYRLSLSLLLSGEDAILESQDSKWPAAAKLQYHADSPEMFDGLKCQPLSILQTIEGRRIRRMELQLAEDRNLLPAKVRIFECQISDVAPAYVAQVTEWQQLSAEAWFPKAITIESFWVQQPGLAGRTSITIHGAKLSPDYPREFFVDVNAETR